MKILMLTDKMELGGAETHILTLTRSLLRRGHSVALASSGGALAKRISSEGARHITLPLSGKSPRELALSYIGLSKLIGSERFDLIHSHARLPSLLVSSLAKKNSVPLVCTVHARFSLSSYRKRLSRWGNLSIAVSQDLKQYLSDCHGIPPENISVIYNGIDTSLFSPSSAPDSTVFRIGFLSRLDGDCSKAAITLCRLAPALISRLGSVEILIGGGGSALSDIKALASRVNSSLGIECIKVLGAVSDVSSFLRDCHLFVGVSRAAMEAALCSLPVILCGNEGYFGILTPENMDKALSTNFCARGCKEISASRLFGDVMKIASGKHSRTSTLTQLLSEKLSSERMAEETLSVYGRAVDSVPAKKSSVLLCGYYGFGNMGDDVLLRSAIKRAKGQFPALSIGALTRKGRRDNAHFGIRCVKRSSPVAIWRELRGCEHFVFGGGTLLQDSTSLRSLIYYVALLRLAKLCGARCHLWGNGIGELSSPLSKALAKRALDICEDIGMRDSLSLKKAAALSSRSHIYADKDLASDRKPSSKERCEYLLSRAFGEFSALPDFIIVAPREGNGLSELKKALYMARCAGMTLCFIPMHKTADSGIARCLCRKYGGILIDRICYADLVGLATYSKGVYSMRLHGLMAARAAGVPCRAFGSDSKLRCFDLLY